MVRRRNKPMPYGWSRIRRGILKRDGGTCTHILGTDLVMMFDGSIAADAGADDVAYVIAYAGDRCPSVANQVHHTGDDDDHSDSNLVSLCTWHHNEITSAEAIPKFLAAQKKAREKQSRHPGML